MDATAELLSKKEKEEDCPKPSEDRTKIIETEIKEEIDAEQHPNTSLLSRECEQIFIKEEATEQDLPRKILLERSRDNCRVFIKEEAQDENAAMSREEDDPLTR
jgi:hypothetical protein